MKSIISSLFIVIFYSGLYGQFDADQIPENLKEDADAVVLFKHGEFEIGKVDKARYRVHQAITVLSKEGDYFGLPNVSYDKLRKVALFNATVYDSSGKKIDKAKNADINDESSVSGYSLYEDDRVMWADLRQDTYPYTVEFEYEIKFKYLYSIPDWVFLPTENVSVLESDYKIIYPPELAPRCYTHKFEGTTDTTFIEDLISVHWKIKNLQAFEREPYGPSFTKLTPAVRIAPGKFDYDGYEGDMSTWDGLAKWQTLLNEGRDDLPEKTIGEIRALTEGKEPIDKVKTVYDFVQNSTRYVSIQLGIGGFQPFPASVVDEVGYGDCKALTFYTQSLLKNVGINSYYTWISAGDSPGEVREDFPNDTFNHIILCVPIEKDTIWLECTNQTTPFGYLGSFTSNRKALVINGNQGTIVKTRGYALENNMRITSANVRLDNLGNADVTVALDYGGLEYESRGLDLYVNYNQEEQKKWIERNINIPSFSVRTFEFINNKEMIPSAEVKADIAARKIVSKSGSRFFLQPNILNKTTFIPEKNDNRIQPVLIQNSWVEYDTINFELPENVVLEASFDSLAFESQFGKYYASIIKKDDRNIAYVRKFEFYEGEYSPETYQELYEFFKNISLADKKRISLVNKT